MLFHFLLLKNIFFQNFLAGSMKHVCEVQPTSPYLTGQAFTTFLQMLIPSKSPGKMSPGKARLPIIQKKNNVVNTCLHIFYYFLKLCVYMIIFTSPRVMFRYIQTHNQKKFHMHQQKNLNNSRDTSAATYPGTDIRVFFPGE